MNNFISEWRKRNGLNYRGWLSFIVKRWLRFNGFGFLVPFDMHMRWENSCDVTVTIWEFGTTRSVRLCFRNSIDAGSILNKVREMGVTSSKVRFLMLTAMSNKIVEKTNETDH